MVLLERILPGCQRGAGRPIEFFVAPLNHPERTLIKPEPDVQAVLENTFGVLGVPAASAFAAQPPAHLVKRNLIFLLPAWLVGEGKRCHHAAHASAQDRNLFLGSSFCHRYTCELRDTLNTVIE